MYTARGRSLNETIKTKIIKQATVSVRTLHVDIMENTEYFIHGF
jgi:hypothetical protein